MAEMIWVSIYETERILSMKLRTRLMISFCIIIFVPVMLATVAVWGYGQLHTWEIQRSYNITTDPYEYLTNSVRIFSSYTDYEYNLLSQMVLENSKKLENMEYLQEVNGELLKKDSYLIFRKGEEILFSGCNTFPADLPKHNIGDHDQFKNIYLSQGEQILIKQIDFLCFDGSEGSVFIVTNMTKMIPEVKKSMGDILFSMILILVFTAAILVIWIYMGIYHPIQSLQTAAENIKEGNLDFTLQPKHNDEIGALCHSFEAMRMRLKDSAEEKIRNENQHKVLISNISHDLKTPITAIKGYVEGIIDGVADTPEKIDKYIRTIYNKANEMDTLINELTLYSEINTNRIPYNFSRIKVSQYFEDCAEDLEFDLESKGIRLAYMNYSEENIEIIADPEQLKRVINNIVGNSVKYLDKEKGFIHIRIRDVGDFIQIEIEDNGKGIATKALPYIFDRFYRTDTSRNSATGGSGIGLSIAKKIIEDHGGSIWATSKEQRGTTMYFVIRKYQNE